MRAKTWVSGLLVLLVAGAAATLLLLPEEEAEAGFTSETTKDLVDYLNGDAAFGLKLQALEVLRKRTESGIDGELEKLAKGDDGKLSVFVTTALGKRKTSGAKKKLKGLLENTDLDVEVRMGALSAIAYHWKDSGDLSYLESKTKSNTALKSHCAALKSEVYGK